MIIIGIAGGSGSGKTTVVKRIAKALPPHCAAIIPLDSYYNDTTDLTDEERKAINFDHPDAFDWKLLTDHIKKLKNGEAIEQPTYSYVISNRLPETVHIEPKPVIILEGIMTLHHKKLRDMMDLKIYVDTDSDVRLIRNIRRDVVERGRTVEMVLSHYENDVKPMHEQFIEPTKKFADLIIPWGRENKRGIDILRTYIQGFSEEVREEMKNREDGLGLSSGFGKIGFMALWGGVAGLIGIFYLFRVLYLFNLLHFLSLLELLCLGVLAPVVVEVDRVDHLCHAIQQCTPAENQHGYARRIHRTDKHIDACEEDDGGKYPVSKSYFAELTGVYQVHILVDGT